MPETIYFQWQNEHLRRTIYPLREMKLRDFLVYYKEIDIWQQYEDKTLDDLGDEVQAHKNTQKNLISNAYDQYHSLRSYFLTKDVSEDYGQRYPDLDQDFMEKINQIHRSFNKYFPGYDSIFKERYFLASQISLMENHRKQIEREIANKERNVRNMGEKWSQDRGYPEILAKLKQTTLAMADEELQRLYDFLSAFARIEDRRATLIKWKATKAKERASLSSQISKMESEVSKLGQQLAEIEAELGRLKNPPDHVALEDYLTREDVSSDFKSQFGELDQDVIDRINELHKANQSYFNSHEQLTHKILFIKGRIRDLHKLLQERQNELAEIERKLRNMPDNWSRRPGYESDVKTLTKITFNMIKIELDQLNDFLAALEMLSKTPEVVKKEIEQKSEEHAEIEGQRKKAAATLNSLKDELQQVEIVFEQPEKEQLMSFVNFQNLTVRDIVRGKVEAYQNELSQLNHEELLEAVADEFIENTARYPLWLQYMVIHFSGMRYKSAHGSWADPKDLLLSLRIHAVEKKVDRAIDEALDALCEEKILAYRPRAAPENGQDPAGDAGVLPPKLALAQEPIWKNKVEDYLETLEQTTSPYRKRKTLLDLCIDEESYEIEALTDREALEELEGMKDNLPDWMWKEIVQVTDLRLSEVSNENWEQLSPDDLEARRAHEMWEYRQIMDKWKQENLTGWREEHDRANRLIVTRAVCNEVAEHIQHLRGHSVPGGLTAKPEWYLRKERDPALAGRAYFVKPRTRENFKEGASILWLRYVDSEPNAWQIAHPITLKNGEGLLGSRPGTRPSNFRAALNRSLSRSKGSSATLQSEWKQFQDSGGRFRRAKMVVDESKKKTVVNQWLRWMHEATVAEVAETADGPVVLTFETALPYEDKRRSTIGVFKHSLYNLEHNVSGASFTGTFAGYVPHGDIPYEDLEEMMDWNKILQKKRLSSTQVEDYWHKIRQMEKAALESGPSGEFTPQPTAARAGVRVEAAPLVEMVRHKERVIAYEIDSAKKRAKVYQPRVEIGRGALLVVDKQDGVRIGGHTYYQVLQCEGEPRAQDLYVRVEELIEAPEGSASKPVVSKEKLNLRRLSRANKSGKPIMERYSVQIPPGTKLRVSTVHKATPEDAGNGVIDADGPDDYYLIVECYQRASAIGLFLRVNDVQEISEEEYQPLKPMASQPA